MSTLISFCVMGLDYQPLIGKGARAFPKNLFSGDFSGRNVDRIRDSGENRGFVIVILFRNMAQRSSKCRHYEVTTPHGLSDDSDVPDVNRYLEEIESVHTSL